MPEWPAGVTQPQNPSRKPDEDLWVVGFWALVLFILPIADGLAFLWVSNLDLTDGAGDEWLAIGLIMALNLFVLFFGPLRSRESALRVIYAVGGTVLTLFITAVGIITLLSAALGDG